MGTDAVLLAPGELQITRFCERRHEAGFSYASRNFLNVLDRDLLVCVSLFVVGGADVDGDAGWPPPRSCFPFFLLRSELPPSTLGVATFRELIPASRVALYVFHSDDQGSPLSYLFRLFLRPRPPRHRSRLFPFARCTRYSQSNLSLVSIDAREHRLFILLCDALSSGCPDQTPKPVVLDERPRFTEPPFSPYFL